MCFLVALVVWVALVSCVKLVALVGIIIAREV